MKKLLPSLVLLLVAFGALRAQDETIFNHYVQNPIILNPAAAGFADEYVVFLNARAQWSGFEDSPKTIAARINGPIGQSFGIGGAIFTESAAQQRRLKGQVDVAFRFGLGEAVRDVQPFQAAFGFFTQFQRLTLDPSILNNPQIEPGDLEIMRLLDGRNQFDAGIGVYGSYLDRVFGGLTINNLVSNRLKNISGSNTNEGLNFTFLLGQRFKVEELNVNLTPSIMIRDVQDAPFMMDFNLQAGFLNDQFIAGLSYRYLGAIGLLLGTNLNGFQVYYSYDLGFGGFQPYNNGSHEFTVGYALSRASVVEAQRRSVREEGKR
ncbi:PorP/SprF family type IX secretion system membrane protein [Neolewinella lacunae]|uniref:Type IX secretion system membrane protein PorP/SprF n=1 Tax=Neolewinella lacunae TaxID=1517758 RepID=A0A923PQI4_9BACT|nr:PorP/SprF family type IX secretion system membrane protein [Neolewinella lacunae]MBC6995598.1 type IX secretion system membrane protein PorP/SprF [Neolewinella lacunae]MDN3635634.1 PorP/SprF family type IX secretion system membrane protein [Neolewinella lacunae]